MKIALVAMSGVRVRSAELFSLGVTLPGFVDRSKVIASLPSLGLLTIAGATPPDHAVHYFEHVDVSAERLADDRFDIVAISTFTAQAPEAYELADACRARGLRVAIGGLHASVVPDEAAAHADHVIAGEAEEAWPELLADLVRGEARRIYDARGRVFDLARAPLPRYELLDLPRYNRVTIQTTRSCPHLCTFCASGILLRGPYRRKPVELVRRDLDAITTLWYAAAAAQDRADEAAAASAALPPGYGPFTRAPRDPLRIGTQPFVELADDNTFVDKAWSRRLVEAIAPYGIKWFTESDVTLADDPELLEMLAPSGCRQVLVGLEAVDRASVAGLEDRPFKAARVERYADAVRTIQEHGVSVNGCFVLGADHHTPADVARIVEFADRVGLAEVQVTVLTPFPGTPLYERMLAAGRILRPGDWGACTLFDVTFRPASMSVRELEESLMHAFRQLYTPDRVRARRRAFHAQARAGRRARRRGGRPSPRAA